MLYMHTYTKLPSAFFFVGPPWSGRALWLCTSGLVTDSYITCFDLVWTSESCSRLNLSRKPSEAHGNPSDPPAETSSETPDPFQAALQNPLRTIWLPSVLCVCVARLVVVSLHFMVARGNRHHRHFRHHRRHARRRCRPSSSSSSSSSLSACSSSSVSLPS